MSSRLHFAEGHRFYIETAGNSPSSVPCDASREDIDFLAISVPNTVMFRADSKPGEEIEDTGSERVRTYVPRCAGSTQLLKSGPDRPAKSGTLGTGVAGRRVGFQS